MRPAQSLRLALTQADVLKLAFLLEDDHVPDRLLDRPRTIDARGLECVDFLRAPQRSPACVDALPQPLHAIAIAADASA